MKTCIAKTKNGKPCTNPSQPGSDYCHIAIHCPEEEKPLTDKERRFVEEYCVDYNGSGAARRAGYSERSCGTLAARLLEKDKIKRAIEARMEKLSMSAAEAVKRLADWGRGSLSPFHVEDGIYGGWRIDLTTEEAKANLHLIKKIKTNDVGIVTEIELHDAKDAVDKILKIHGKYIDRVQVEDVTPEPWDPEQGDPAEFVQERIRGNK